MTKRRGIDTRIMMLILFAAIALVLIIAINSLLNPARDMVDNGTSGGYTPDDIRDTHECQVECMNSPDPEACMEKCG